MTTDMILLLVLVIFLVLLVCETPVAWSLAAAGALGISLMRSPDLAASIMGTSPYKATASYSLAIVPMHILLGMFALNGRLAERLYRLASRALGALPGGLGVATVGACAGFAAVTGSSVATAATIGKVSIREMQKFGYPVSFAAGIVAAAGTLGILIPPSIVIVIYGVLAQESIAQLLVAGIIPGILSACVYATYIVVRGRDLVQSSEASLSDLVDRETRRSGRGSGATAASSVEQVVASATLVADDEVMTRAQSYRAVAWIALIFGVILTGIYSGYFTVIESGAMAAFIGLLMVIFENRANGIADIFRKFYGSLLEAANITSMAFAILVSATILSTFLVMSRVPMNFTAWVLSFDVPPVVIVIALLLTLIPLGMALETLSILIITVPLMHPVVVGLGYDGVWFAILVVKMIEIGMVTPPVGINVFVVSGASGAPIEQAFRGVLPFVLLDLAFVGALIAFPEVVLWLPSMVAK